MGTGLALATDVTSALRSCFSLAMDCLYPRDPPQPVRKKNCLFVPHGLEVTPVVCEVVCEVERPSELSWRARHGRKKTIE